MTKADLVVQAADVVGPRVTKKDCGLVVNAFLDSVKDALERGEGIEIRGFGTFKVRPRKARTARNPKTGEPVEVAAHAVPVFQPSRFLRDRVTRGNRPFASRDTRGGWRRAVARRLAALPEGARSRGAAPAPERPGRVRPVPGRDGTEAIPRSRSFPAIEAVLPPFQGGGIGYQPTARASDRAVPIELTVIPCLDSHRRTPALRSRWPECCIPL